MKQLRIAILGQGRSGRDIHGLHMHTDTERFKVVAVVDPMDIRRERAKNEFGCDVYSDYREILSRDDIDLVVNSTPSHLHYPITKDLLSHGFNVLCEKPFVPKVEYLDELEALAHKNNVELMVFQQSRFAGYFEQVKSVIASGELGRICEVSIRFNGFARRWDWQCCLDFNGGSLANTGPHPLDQALNLMNDYDRMPDVFCRMDSCNSFGDAEDFVKLILSAPGKPLIDLEISSSDAYPSYTYKVQGTRGTLEGNMSVMKWKYFIADEAPEQHLIREPLTHGDEKLPAYCGEKLQWYEKDWNGDANSPFTFAVKKYYDTVYDHLTKGTDLVVTLAQVRQQIAVIRESHRQNGRFYLENI